MEHTKERKSRGNYVREFSSHMVSSYTDVVLNKCGFFGKYLRILVFFIFDLNTYRFSMDFDLL